MNTSARVLEKLTARAQYHLSQYLQKRVVKVQPEAPIISFTFDDFPHSAYRTAGAILKGHNARGTYYAALGLMNTTTESVRQFDIEDLQELIKDGHELACHTFNHVVCGTVTCAEYERNIIRNAEEVAKVLRGYRLRNFSYPRGRVSAICKKRISGHFRSMCGIRAGINAGRMDLNLLHRNCLYHDNSTINNVEKLIRENERVRGWLIFYTHDVCDRPSPFGCTRQHFEAVAELADRSGSQILTVDQALNTILVS